MPSLHEHVEHFAKRVVQDALADATARYWSTRAEQFDNAMPRPDDFTGNATPEQIEEQRMRLASTALACRQRAAISLIGGAAHG
jgi:hypothetical protein